MSVSLALSATKQSSANSLNSIRDSHQNIKITGLMNKCQETSIANRLAANLDAKLWI